MLELMIELCQSINQSINIRLFDVKVTSQLSKRN